MVFSSEVSRKSILRPDPTDGRYYDQKKVEVFYTIEGDVIVTVTVYVFYGKWEGNADSL